MIYAMSDIHGCVEELKKQMEQVDLSGDNRIVFCGDYIDYGDSSCQVLKCIWNLQKKYGAEKVVVLKGNHEQMFLDWIRDYRRIYSDGTEDYMVFNDWLRTDFEYGANTISTFISEQQMDFLNQIYGENTFSPIITPVYTGSSSEIRNAFYQKEYHKMPLDDFLNKYHITKDTYQLIIQNNLYTSL